MGCTQGCTSDGTIAHHDRHPGAFAALLRGRAVAEFMLDMPERLPGARVRQRHRRCKGDMPEADGPVLVERDEFVLNRRSDADADLIEARREILLQAAEAPPRHAATVLRHWEKVAEVWEAQRLPGDHYSMLTEPNVTLLAEHVKTYLSV